MPNPTDKTIATALATLEKVLRDKPYVANDDAALGSLGAVATQIGRNRPSLKGYAVGKADESPYDTFDKDGNAITVDPAADRKAANATLVGK